MAEKMPEFRLLGREHYDLIEAFERDHHGRFDKEDKSLWPKGHVYQDGRVNDLFVSFRLGYSFARAALSSLQTHEGQPS